MSRRLHLNVNILNKGVFGGSWRFPGTVPDSAYGLEHQLQITRSAERAGFDAIFLADGPGLDPDIRFRSANGLEPSVVLARLAAETESIGLIGTFSSSYNDPQELAVRLASIDALSGGRFGWNVVTTAGSLIPANFGRHGEPEHGWRYRRAAEVITEVTGVWESGRDAQGRPIPVSPQGRPVVVQAGGSTDGKRLASAHAEVVFSAAQTLEDAVAFAAELRRGAVAAGRSPDDLVVLPGLSTVIGSTEEEARRRRDTLTELLPTEYALGRLSSQLGITLGVADLDTALDGDRLPAPDDAGGSQTFYRLVREHILRERPTVRALLAHLGGGAGHRIVVGTPEQVADDIERWFLAGAADGFNLMPDVLPEGIDLFTDHVVPILRQRGLFREGYSGRTLRDHLGLDWPRPERERVAS
ncbi:MAG: LLM class flavin-dependent oxidoreductase [Mycetocola sp.]